MFLDASHRLSEMTMEEMQWDFYDEGKFFWPGGYYRWQYDQFYTWEYDVRTWLLWEKEFEQEYDKIHCPRCKRRFQPFARWWNAEWIQQEILRAEVVITFSQGLRIHLLCLVCSQEMLGPLENYLLDDGSIIQAYRRKTLLFPM